MHWSNEGRRLRCLVRPLHALCVSWSGATEARPIQIDWTDCTPLVSCGDGILIGLTAILLLANGRIAGVSGIAGGLLRPAGGDTGWRFACPADDRRLLVGVGTCRGAGCTSGHGVCGIARRSPHSPATTACFVATGFLTVFVTRHVIGA